MRNPPPQVDDHERARRAVTRFRAMLPGLNGYVRAISGRKDLRIELSSGQPRTDGKKIYFEPPIQLGDDLTHVRNLCDRRDPETMQQLCHSCAVREDLLIKIYHEMAHNIHGTFEMHVSGTSLVNKIHTEISKLEPKRAEQIQKQLSSQNEPPRYRSYLELASQINPFLPVLVNALEDLRVDEAMFKARKGTRVMFYAMTRNIFVNGIPELDGSITEWKNMPLNSQALVGIFVAGCRYNYTDWFHPKVEAALRDETIQNLVADVDEMKSSLETFQRAFPILERLRELGFCLTEEEYDEKEQEGGDNGEESDFSSSEEDGTKGGDRGSESSNADSGESDNEASDDQAEVRPASKDNEDSSENDASVEDTGTESSSNAPEEVSPERGDVDSDSELDGSASDEAGPGDNQSDSDSTGSDRSEHGDEAESTSVGDEDEDKKSSSGGSPRESGDSSDAGAEAPLSLDELTNEENSSDRKDRQEDGGSDDVLDTGADEGRGGIPLKEVFGSAEQAEQTIEAVTKHGDHAESSAGTERVGERTIVQAVYFEKESGTVSSVKEHFVGDGCESDAWTVARGTSSRNQRRLGIKVGEQGVGENILGPALLHMRRVFSDNARSRVEPHLRSGRVNARVLGKRAPFHDPRLFQKKRNPGKRSYAVLIGIDISGSTIGVNIALAKIAAFAQAELCNRLGIDFAVYAHTASPVAGTHILDMYCIKDFDSPWDTKAQKALLEIASWSENLDGHSLEFYRKKIEKYQATDKIILYYSDGKMPAANYSEELAVLQREIKTCKQKNITLLGVGIRTDSPTKHGLDTVQVDGPDEVGKVVQHLESRILHNR